MRMEKYSVEKRNLWTRGESVDYNPSMLELAIKNKQIAEERKDYNEMDKWDKVISFHKKKR